MPNVRKDGLEIVLNSERRGGLGGRDVYTARHASTSEPWSSPVNLGGLINTADNEMRSSLSWDGLRLRIGHDGEIQVSTRSR